MNDGTGTYFDTNSHSIIKINLSYDKTTQSFFIPYLIACAGSSMADLDHDPNHFEGSKKGYRYELLLFWGSLKFKLKQLAPNLPASIITIL